MKNVLISLLLAAPAWCSPDKPLEYHRAADAKGGLASPGESRSAAVRFFSGPEAAAALAEDDEAQAALEKLLPGGGPDGRGAAVALAQALIVRRDKLAREAKAAGAYQAYAARIDAACPVSRALAAGLLSALDSEDEMQRFLAAAAAGRLKLAAAAPRLRAMKSSGSLEQRGYAERALAALEGRGEEPDAAAPAPAPKKGAAGGKPYLTALPTTADFDSINGGAPVYFVLDQCSGALYFFSPSRYKFHRDFAAAQLGNKDEDKVYYNVGFSGGGACLVNGVLSRGARGYDAWIMPEESPRITTDNAGMRLREKVSGRVYVTAGTLYPRDSQQTDWRYTMINGGTATGRLKVISDPQRDAPGPGDVALYVMPPDYLRPAAANLLTVPLSAGASAESRSRGRGSVPGAVILYPDFEGRTLEGLCVTLKVMRAGYALYPAFPWEPGCGEAAPRGASAAQAACVSSTVPAGFAASWPDVRQGWSGDRAMVDGRIGAYQACRAFKARDEKPCAALRRLGGEEECFLRSSELLFAAEVFRGDTKAALKRCAGALGRAGAKNADPGADCALLQKDFREGSCRACQRYGAAVAGAPYRKLLAELGCAAECAARNGRAPAWYAQAEGAPYPLVFGALKNGGSTKECSGSEGCRAFTAGDQDACGALLRPAIEAYCAAPVSPARP